MTKLVDLMREYQYQHPKATFDEAIWLVIGFEAVTPVPPQPKLKPAKGIDATPGQSPHKGDEKHE